MPLVDLLNTLLWAGQNSLLILGTWNAVITWTLSHRFLSTWGAVMLENKQTNKQTNQQKTKKQATECINEALE